MFVKIMNGCAIGFGLGLLGVVVVAGVLTVDAGVASLRSAELDALHLEHYRARWSRLHDSHQALTAKFVADTDARWARACADAETIRVLRADLVSRTQESYEINRELAEARDAYQLEHELAGRLVESRDSLKDRLDAVRAALSE